MSSNAKQTATAVPRTERSRRPKRRGRLAARFGVKIVLIMLLMAVTPLVVSSFLVGQVIKVSDSVAEGQARNLAGPLEQAADGYRRLFMTQKALFRAKTRLLALDQTLNRALTRLNGGAGGQGRQLERRLSQLRRFSSSIESMRVYAASAGKPRVVATLEVPGAKSMPGRRRLRATEQMPAGGQLEIVFSVSPRPFEDFRAIGRAERAFKGIAGLRAELSQHYRAAFLIMFGAALVLATALGLLIARRLARRVGRLVGATRAVAGGDLDVQVEMTSRDELGELADAFNEMVGQLKDNRERIAYLEKIGAWQEIARQLAHQIKNPLTPIQLALQQVHQKYSGEDQRFARLLDDAHEIVTEEVNGLRRLVRDFSVFAKLPNVSPEPTEAHTLIDDFIKSHSDLVERARVKWRPPSERSQVLADRMLVKHVLYNLVENAVQVAEAAATPNFEVVLDVIPRPEQGCVAFCVRDNGPGMETDTAAHAFDPYFTRREGGTGLGLSIVKKIILEHQGTITLRSSPGQGAEFEFSLPLA